MGNDCSNEERKIRYMAFQEALITIDKEIKKELNNPYSNAKKYNSYGLINKEICTKYPFLLNEKFDTTLSNYPIFNYNIFSIYENRYELKSIFLLLKINI